MHCFEFINSDPKASFRSESLKNAMAIAYTLIHSDVEEIAGISIMDPGAPMWGRKAMASALTGLSAIGVEGDYLTVCVNLSLKNGSLELCYLVVASSNWPKKLHFRSQCSFVTLGILTIAI